MNHKLIIIFLLTTLLYLSCETKTANQNENREPIASSTADIPSVTIKPFSNVPEHFDAILEMREPSDINPKPGEVKFVFDIRNFELRSGNSITMNLNNKQFLQTSSPETSVRLNPGSYIAVSFLSLPNQVSLKNYGNYVVRTFSVGDVTTAEIDDTAPMIFYNIPRGRFQSKNGQIILDFFLLNTSLSANGHQVKIEIAGQEFLVAEWIPYLIEGLGNGSHELKLTLVDRNGKTIDGPFQQAKGNFHLN